MKQVRVRMRKVFFVTALMGLQAILWAGSAIAAPMGSGGRAETTFVRTSQEAGGGLSDAVLIAIGAGLSLVIVIAVSFTMRGVRRLRHATA